MQELLPGGIFTHVMAVRSNGGLLWFFFGTENTVIYCKEID